MRCGLSQFGWAVLFGAARAQSGSSQSSTEVGGQCNFTSGAPAGVGHFWDPTCVNGGLGCKADGQNLECRVCGGGIFVNVTCPPSTCHFAQPPYIPYYWDASCELGDLGCLADGQHTQCRFCGDFPYSTVACPESYTAAPPAVSCAFESEPEVPVYWEPGCVDGMLGCNADGQNMQCRHCGLNEFSHVHCPGSQVCAFPNIPTVPYYYDPDCQQGMTGCDADGVHIQCRFCGVEPYESVPCPEPHEGLHICRSFLGNRTENYFWDDSCFDGQLGCYADGMHLQCRFCGGTGDYEEVPCPNEHSGNLRRLRGSSSQRWI